MVASRIIPLLLAVGVSAFLWFRPSYARLLRSRVAAQDPGAWANETMNGRYRVLVPELIATRHHDEAMYAARVRQILLHGRPYNPYIREERSPRSWLHQCLTMYAMAGFAWLCRGDLNSAWLLAGSLLAGAWFLLFEAIFRWWTGKGEVAIPLALGSILFPDIYYWLLDVNFNAPVVLERVTEVFFQRGAAIRPHFYRLPANFLTLLALALLLLGAWRILSRERLAPARSLAVGAGFGALALVHAYQHVFGLGTLFVLTALSWWRREADACRRNLALMLGAGLAVTALYAWLMASFIDAPSRAYALVLSGLVSSRRFYLVTVIHLLFAALGFWRLSRESDPGRRWAWLILSASQLAAFCCRNGQVLAGVMIQPFHFIPLASFTGGLMLFLWLGEAMANASWWRPRAAWAAGLAAVFLALANEKSSAERTARLLGLPRDVEEALEWVDDHVPVDGLVLSLSAEANKTIPLYTKAKVQVSPPDPNIASPFTSEEYFLTVARLLRTLEVQPRGFLEERWLLSARKNALLGRIGREQNLLGKVDRELLEPAMWFYPQYSWDKSDEPILAGRRRIEELCRQAPKVEPPFLLWLDRKDERYLSRGPQALGGRLVYKNPSIGLYAFSK